MALISLCFDTERPHIVEKVYGMKLGKVFKAPFEEFTPLSCDDSFLAALIHKLLYEQGIHLFFFIVSLID